MVPKTLPDADYLRECFTYDPDTGILRWRHRPLSHFATLRACNIWNTRLAGEEAGFMHPSGHRMVKLTASNFLVHRVVWKLVYNVEPSPELDHRNVIASDNRLGNLRVATTQENRCNVATRSDNTSGLKGVSWCRWKQKWMARIHVNGRRVYLGCFDDPLAAYQVYCEASRNLHGEFSRTS